MKCCYCGGHTIEATTTYFEQLDNMIVIIKNVPCHKCSQCGEVFFNGAVAERLEQITEQLEKTLTEVAIVNYSVA